MARQRMSRLHELGVPLSGVADLSSILQQVLDGVIELQNADFGHVQLLNRGSLEIATTRGIGKAFVARFGRLAASSTSASSRALRNRERVIIEDILADPDSVSQRPTVAATAFRGVQSTPLLDSRTGAPVGMLSTHFRLPHRPTVRELHLTDVYARLAADVIAFRVAEQRLQIGHEHLRLALEAGRMGTWEWNTQTGMVKADGAHRALFGLSPEVVPEAIEVYGAHMAAGAIDADIAAARAAFASGTAFQVEQHVTRTKGRTSWIQLVGHAMTADRNTMIGVSFDITERKRIEDALRESEARLQAAVDLVRLGLYSWDPRTNALVWDARVKAIWGLPPDAHVDYEGWLGGVHPDDQAAVLAAVERCLDPDGDGVYDIQYRVVGVDGVERWVATRGHANFVGRQPVGFEGVTYDITARKRAETLLAESEARLASILEQLPAGVGLYDLDDRLIKSNTILRQYLTSDIIPPNGTVAGRWRALAADGNVLERSEYPRARARRGDVVVPGIDFVHTTEQGRETWMRMSAAPFRDQSGNIAGVVTVIQNIDGQKQSEQAVRESDERFRQFAEHSSQVLWILGAGIRTVEYLSRAYESIWGKPRDGAPAAWIEATYPDDRDSVAAAREKAFQGEPVVHQYRILRADDTVRWIRETVFPIRDQYGRVQRIGGIAQDVTGTPISMVYVVDPDEAHRQKLLLLFQQAGYGTKAFTAGTDLIDVAPVLAAGCVVLHAEPRIDALAILKQLKARGSALPVIVLGKSDGNITLAVEAMKAGAVDWLETPYVADTLLATLAAALAEIRQAAEHDREAEWARGRIATMSERERQVLDGLLAGGTNKVIGRKLGISPRTVELHRASVMEQLGARTLPEAVLKAAAAGLRPPALPRKS